MDDFSEGPLMDDYLEMKDYYSLEEIRKAFWLTFHKSGEVFFDFMSEESAISTTQCVWEAFQDGLKSEVSWEDITKELDTRGPRQLELKLED